MGKHNHVTTTYHLLLEKKKRSGGFLKAAQKGFQNVSNNHEPVRDT